MIDATAVARLREQHAAATAGELVKASSEYYDHCLYISGELVPFACFERIEDLWLHRAAHNALPDVLDALEQAWRERDALAAELAQVRGQLHAQPSDYENERAEERIRQIDLLFHAYGMNRDKWPQHAQDSFERLDTAQREYEAKYC